MNITDLFIRLVSIDSPSGEERGLREYLRNWLAGQGFSVKEDATGNVYARNHAAGAPLLLSAHMDTVEPGKGIRPVVKNGVIRSDGKTILGADNKAAIAAIMTAVEKDKNSKPLEILFTVREETGGGVEFLPKGWITAKKALVFDSAKPLGGIILRSPYIVNFMVTLTGKAAHASLPEEGMNAFTPAFHALSSLETGRLDEGQTTVNVGTVAGGTGINTIPGQIEIKGEVRSYDKALFEKRIKLIQSLFTLAATEAKIKLGFSLGGYCPGYAHEKSNGMIKAAGALIRRLDLPVTYYPFSGVSDANILNDRGIMTVNMADGTVGAHTVGEHITVADLDTLSRLVYECITNL